MSAHSLARPNTGLRSRRRVRPRTRDPRRFLIAALALSLVSLMALPHVAEALSGLAAQTIGSPTGERDGGCRVTEFVDGDTVTLSCPNRAAERARLTGFDTPELFSPKCSGERDAASQAKRHLGRLVDDADRLGVLRQGHDRYGRALVALSVDGRPVAREMIAAGLARPYDGGRRDGWCAATPAPVDRGTSAKWVRGGG